MEPEPRLRGGFQGPHDGHLSPVAGFLHKAPAVPCLECRTHITAARIYTRQEDPVHNFVIPNHRSAVYREKTE